MPMVATATAVVLKVAMAKAAAAVMVGALKGMLGASLVRETVAYKAVEVVGLMAVEVLEKGDSKAEEHREGAVMEEVEAMAAAAVKAVKAMEGAVACSEAQLVGNLAGCTVASYCCWPLQSTCRSCPDYRTCAPCILDKWSLQGTR